jgi:pantothenate kinase-related protein Tda10
MRLPTVKRPRYDAEAHAGPDDRSGVPEDVPLASALTVDLIAELVANGSLAPHLASFPSAPSHISQIGA